jgi:ECF transporter S component (folate family)
LKKTKTVVFMGLLVALDVVAASFLTIKTPFLKIGISFIPVSFTGIVFGPFLGGIGAALADIIQYLLFPTGAWLPGITFDAFLSGAVYGLLLYRKAPSFWRCAAAAAICQILISGLLSTVWIYLAVPGKTFTALFISREIKSLIMTPIETIGIYSVWRLTRQIKIIKAC